MSPILIHLLDEGCETHFFCGVLDVSWAAWSSSNKRDRAPLSLETRYDNERFEYVADVFHPDVRRDTERFDRREAFSAWLRRSRSGWRQNGGRRTALPRPFSQN